MKILLACAGGMSSSILEKSIREYLHNNNIEGEITATSINKARKIIGSIDIMLLAPQISFMLKEFSENTKNIPVVLMPPLFYGRNNAEGIVKIIINTLK